MEVTAESEVEDDKSESEDIDYHYYLPGERLDTDFIETRLLTRPETTPDRERHLGEKTQPIQTSVGRPPTPVDLEGKGETLSMEKQDRVKGCVPGRETVQVVPVEIISSKSEELPAPRDVNEPSSDRSNSSGWKGSSAVVDPEAEVISKHREIDYPKMRRALFGKSQDSPPDVSREEDEVLPVQLSMSESALEPNIMDESLPVYSDLSFSGSSKDEGCFVHKLCEDMSVNRTNEGTAVGMPGRKTPPVIMGESESDGAPRRSQRHREQPERLQYGQLGNPLLSIVQSLFQGLNLAFADALQNHGYADAPQKAPRPHHSHMGVMGHTHL